MAILLNTVDLQNDFEIMPFKNWKEIEQEIIDTEKERDKFIKGDTIKSCLLSILLAAIWSPFIIATTNQTGRWTPIVILMEILLLFIIVMKVLEIYDARKKTKLFDFPFWWAEVDELKDRIKLQKELNFGTIKKIVTFANHAQVEIEKLEGQVTIKSHFKVKTCQQNNLDRVILDVEKGMLFLPTCK